AHVAARGMRSSIHVPPPGSGLVEADVLQRLTAALAELVPLLLEAIENVPFAGLDLGTVLVDVTLALGGAVREGRHRALEAHRRIVERVVAARRELVLVGVETGQQTSLTRRDILAARLELRLAALLHLVGESTLTRCSGDRSEGAQREAGAEHHEQPHADDPPCLACDILATEDAPYSAGASRLARPLEVEVVRCRLG